MGFIFSRQMSDPTSYMGVVRNEDHFCNFEFELQFEFCFKFHCSSISFIQYILPIDEVRYLYRRVQKLDGDLLINERLFTTNAHRKTLSFVKIWSPSPKYHTLLSDNFCRMLIELSQFQRRQKTEHPGQGGAAPAEPSDPESQLNLAMDKLGNLRRAIGTFLFTHTGRSPKSDVSQCVILF